MYRSPYNTVRPYTGQSLAGDDDRCPVCGSTGGDCPDAVAVPMPHPPVDIAEDSADVSGPLQRYTVTVNGVATTMRLNDSDAARYGSAAIPIL